jgi:DNA end-binding protein Ku
MKEPPMARAKRKKKAVHHKPAANDDAPALSRRPVWEGHLRLSLVSCPVRLFNATTHANEISFHLLNPKTHNRIRMVPTDPDKGPVERADLVKGYEIEKDKYVILTPEDFDAVKLETTHTLDIERFVDEADIDRLYWNAPYYLLPAEESGVEAYTVIRDAMAQAGRIALGRIVMHTRERLMAVEARGNGLVAYSLRMADEVIDVKEAFHDVPVRKPNKQMIEIAQKIIEQKEGAFEPEGFKDRYEKSLRDIIRRKAHGEKIVKAEPIEDTNVIDLMEALKKSLKGKRATTKNGSAKKRKAG